MSVKKVLFVATVVKTHIMTFHTPYLKMFKDMGWETAVAARNDYDAPQDCNIPYCDTYYDIPFERSPMKLSNCKAYRMLKRVIETGEYDIVHCHTPVGALLTRLAARRCRKQGTKVIYTAHGFHFFKGAPQKNWLLYYPVERFLARYTDTLITINREDFQRAQKFSAKKVYYVPGVGVDLSVFDLSEEQRLGCRKRIREELNIPQDAPVVLSVGEVSVRKNQGVLIEAFSKMERKDAYCVICGRGVLMQQLQQRAKELGVSDRVIFTGFRDDVKDFYYAADVFAFPSLQEGLPVAVMEAMAGRLPVICTDIRGSADLIENNVSGVICDNTSDAFARAIDELLGDAAKRETYAAAAARTIRAYELDDVIGLVRDIYCKTLGREQL